MVFAVYLSEHLTCISHLSNLTCLNTLFKPNWLRRARASWTVWTLSLKAKQQSFTHQGSLLYTTFYLGWLSGPLIGVNTHTTNCLNTFLGVSYLLLTPHCLNTSFYLPLGTHSFFSGVQWRYSVWTPHLLHRLLLTACLDIIKSQSSTVWTTRLFGKQTILSEHFCCLSGHFKLSARKASRLHMSGHYIWDACRELDAVWTLLLTRFVHCPTRGLFAPFGRCF